MIRADIFRNENDNIFGFEIQGHAGYGAHGSDIVCSAASMLVINTINSIDMFLGMKADELVADDDNGGYLKCIYKGFENTEMSGAFQLLMHTMVLGLQTMMDNYGEYIQLNDREVL